MNKTEFISTATYLNINLMITDLLKLGEEGEYYDELLELVDSGAMEFWIVNEFLALKLEEHGETVVEIYDHAVWGRKTSGQQLACDSVIDSIYQVLVGNNT